MAEEAECVSQENAADCQSEGETGVVETFGSSPLQKMSSDAFAQLVVEGPVLIES